MSQRVSFWTRCRVAASLFFGLRKPDFQAAGVYVHQRFGKYGFFGRWWRFLCWALYQMWIEIPNTAHDLIVAKKVSRTPMWLIDKNPLANHPWADEPKRRLPEEAVEVIVIGAGFTGAAAAYHWSKRARAKRMVVLEMGDPASGSSGRNEGLVVMGRYFKMVRDTVLRWLDDVRSELTRKKREQLSNQFAEHYCRAAYRNADLIEQTIKTEAFDCDYSRSGWVQARTAEEQEALVKSVQMADDFDCQDWTSIDAAEVKERTGMNVEHNAGFSIAAASWHPAKWVWCLLRKSLEQPNVELFTQTRVTRVVRDAKSRIYRVSTSRGDLFARNIIYATESYTPKLHSEFHDAILPIQEQAASGNGGPEEMKPHVGISGTWFFAGRYGERVLFGSGGSRLPDGQAGRNLPSRFLTRFVASEMKKAYGPYRLHMENEWSGTVGYTPDEFPIVGRIDGQRFIVAGMCGSGSGVSFNGARCIVNRILGHEEVDDYPEEYFAPSRLLNPANHNWPLVGED